MRKLTLGLLALALMALLVPSALATLIPITNITLTWSNPLFTPGIPVYTINNGGVGATSELRWGSGIAKSGYDITPVAPFINPDIPTDNPFILGTFTHLNEAILPPSLTHVDLTLSMDIPGQTVVQTWTLNHNETPNYPPAPACCADIVTWNVPTNSTAFVYNGVNYKINLIGFDQGGGIIDQFISPEGQNNSADLYAEIVEYNIPTIPEPSSLLLFGTGLTAFGLIARVRRSKK
jgi:hypothetical protein